MKIFLLGSCVSRDSLNFGKTGEFQIEEYIARSSLASIFSEIPFDDIFSKRLESKFQQNLVNIDISKRAVQLIEQSDADLYLIDLIDERFDLLETAPEKRCTISGEFRNTGALKDIANAKIIRSGSEDFFKRWEKGFVSLLRILEKANKLDKIRINKVYWQSEMENGEQYKSPSKDVINKANETLSKMYSFIEKHLSHSHFFTYDDNEMKGASTHKWGPAPFHYIDEFYLSTIRKIRESSK